MLTNCKTQQRGFLILLTMCNIFLEFIMKVGLTGTFSDDIRYADDATLQAAIFKMLKGRTKQKTRNAKCTHAKWRQMARNESPCPQWPSRRTRWQQSQVCPIVFITDRRCPEILQPLEKTDIASLRSIRYTEIPILQKKTLNKQASESETIQSAYSWICSWRQQRP